MKRHSNGSPRNCELTIVDFGRRGKAPRPYTASSTWASYLGDLRQSLLDSEVEKGVITTFRDLGTARAVVTISCDERYASSIAAALDGLVAERGQSPARPVRSPATNVLRRARAAQVETPQWTVTVDGDGALCEHEPELQSGGMVKLWLNCTDDEFEQLRTSLERLIVPDGVVLEVNGRAVAGRSPVRSFAADLPVFRRLDRSCTVELYEPEPGEVAGVFERGVFVAESGDRWHYNCLHGLPPLWNGALDQRFLRKLRVAVLNEMHGELGTNDALEEWIVEATSDYDCSYDAFEWYLTARFGSRLVRSRVDMPHADQDALDSGYGLLLPEQLTVGQAVNLRQYHPVPFSNELFGPGETATDGVEQTRRRTDSEEVVPLVSYAQVVPEEELTREMVALEEYAHGLAYHLLGEHLRVRFVKVHDEHACFDGCQCWIEPNGPEFRLICPVFESRLSPLLESDTGERDAHLLTAFEARIKDRKGEASSRYGYTYAAQLAAQLKRISLQYPRWIASVEDELP